MVFNLYTILNRNLLRNTNKMTDGEIHFINSILTEEFIDKLRGVLQGVLLNSVVKLPTLIYAIYHLIVKNANENDDPEKIIVLLLFIVNTIIEIRSFDDDEYTEGEIEELINSSILLLKTNFVLTKTRQKRCWFI